jgi:hypothetical protein
MIWFTCSKCGKTHGRPENSVGSMVFCECGQGNLVPWESTAPEPPPQVAPPQAPPALPGVPQSPTLAPLTFDMSPSRGGPGPVPIDDAGRRRRPGERRDPNYCFNHPSSLKAAPCDDCGESFCATCLVTLDGANLCGPCKNFRVRTLELPPRNSPSAIFSMVIALLIGAVLAFCLLPFSGNTGISIVSLLTLMMQLLALFLGLRALLLMHQEGETRIGGQALAVTGVTTACICILLTLLVNLYALRA